MYHPAPLSLSSSLPQMNYNRKLCPWERSRLLLRATAFNEAEDMGLLWTKKWRLKRALWESSSLYLTQSTEKREVMRSFHSSPSRRQENGVQRRCKEETGFAVGRSAPGARSFWGQNQVWSRLVSGDIGLTIFVKFCSYLRLHILRKTNPDPTIWLSFCPRRTYELQERSLHQWSEAFHFFSSGDTDRSRPLEAPDSQSETIVSTDGNTILLWWQKER